jgi:hypothetical protein
VKRAILDEVERFPNYTHWLRQDVGKFSNGGLAYDLDVKVHNLSIPPSFIGRSYKSMVTYENHFKATTWPTTSNMVT